MSINEVRLLLTTFSTIDSCNDAVCDFLARAIGSIERLKVLYGAAEAGDANC